MLTRGVGKWSKPAAFDAAIREFKSRRLYERIMLTRDELEAILMRLGRLAAEKRGVRFNGTIGERLWAGMAKACAEYDGARGEDPSLGEVG